MHEPFLKTQELQKKITNNKPQLKHILQLLDGEKISSQMSKQKTS